MPPPTVVVAPSVPAVDVVGSAVVDVDETLEDVVDAVVGRPVAPESDVEESDVESAVEFDDAESAVESDVESEVESDV